MPSPALDHHGNNKSSGGTTTTIAITTSANTAVLVFCTIGSTSTSVLPTVSIAGAGLTWTTLDPTGVASGHGLSNFYVQTQAWSAYATSALTAQTVTVTANATIDEWATVFCSYTGTDTLNQIDPNASAKPARFISGATANTLSISTTNADDIAVFAAGSNISSLVSSIVSGATAVDQSVNSTGSRWCNCTVGQLAFSSPQTSATVGWTSTISPLCLVGVALTADPTGGAGSAQARVLVMA